MKYWTMKPATNGYPTFTSHLLFTLINGEKLLLEN